MAVNFYLHPEANRRGEHPIRISVAIGYARILTGIGFSCSKESWEQGIGVRKGYINGKGVSAELINARMIELRSHFVLYESRLTGPVSNDELKEQLSAALGRLRKMKNNASDGSLRGTLMRDFIQFMSDQSDVCQWTEGTKSCWRTFSRHLNSFSADLSYDSFDEEGLNAFLNFLRTGQKLSEKTVRKQYTNLIGFLRWAYRKGLSDNDYFMKHKAKFKILKPPVVFLDKDELLRLYNFKIPENGTAVRLTGYDGRKYVKTVRNAGGMEKTRDLFCFCCFTSLRYSDMAKVRRTDILGNTLYVTSQKTNACLPIDLNVQARMILDKYRDEPFPDGLALPVISNQKMNVYLKDLCELCGFNSPMTYVYYKAAQKVEKVRPKWSFMGTHAGRRTFICFALSLGIPPQIVMKWTGHSDYAAMKPYVDIAEKTKAEAMLMIERALKARK